MWWTERKNKLGRRANVEELAYSRRIMIINTHGFPPGFAPTVDTRKKRNPYLATSSDGFNQAFGKSKEEAIANLKKGIEARLASNT